ncbi:bifunctional riboflavin kinase/FAD synthetase [Aneurinibacillus aneurinilyticus]|jgi:riboflavin kinase/FMN adenylyltransferase|uniref:Riboflavin biosynthesis protein n=2 Tax=Aneurinibacillus aneurinilyticus TaxID=1391 RepID=A0A848CQ09_ANEAE|nr:bifunctional riboflavin kinase/FAD synthetase [Aneurinibacillus aneurinilyticus]ERI09125.1 riboflavin biosynthesis protein RibF [Aneurinibacillus aneurinilyticus ATCC 12856]MCI1692442.1 bifunctional riboflavin kinase/FAD synthetase [Aneurinibacillus aneurinilyticus]MED0669367.1 bifunctional riboflavin kinase/FAD synthetase [Aneurinibacillus aneurinilyticus]MED0707386.1 bifunctional riboflavin kinase/FAD synthetase [Aneurinibacillus aneurinilyticus]MED0724806.1 bifunctional riboflavin kinase
MEIQRLHYPLPPDFKGEPCVLALGYFDGVHAGHRRVIQKAIDTAKSLGMKSAVMTFDPHPREVLGQSGYTQYLTPVDEKLEQLKTMGVDVAYVVHFNISFAAIYPEDFIDEFLIQLSAKHVVVGFDYTFGHRGKGTVFTLKEHSHGRYSVDVIAPVNRFGEKISSTLIREYLYSGKIKEATQFLGRPYCVRGTVVHGEKRGRTIGFPTANLRLSAPYIVPRNGVYGVRAKLEGKVYDGVMNVGIKPTFENERKEKSLEVHLFDFMGDIYDKAMEIQFLFFIREEQKFAGVDALIAQINSDVATAKEQFAKLSIV